MDWGAAPASVLCPFREASFSSACVGVAGMRKLPLTAAVLHLLRHPHDIQIDHAMKLYTPGLAP